MSKKRGNVSLVFLTILFIFILLIFMNIYFVYVQINSKIYPIKNDIFYIVQNSFFSMDKEELRVYNYKIDENELNKKIKDLIKLNYNDLIKVDDLKYDYIKNRVIISYQVSVEPVAFKSILKNKLSFKFNDEIKLKSMEVK